MTKKKIPQIVKEVQNKIKASEVCILLNFNMITLYTYTYILYNCVAVNAMVSLVCLFVTSTTFSLHTLREPF